MIELIQLKQLVAVAQSKTLSAASEDLAISQSALSRSIRRLEEDLGARLFDRQKQRIILNDAGRLAVFHAEKILSATKEMQESLLNFEKSRRVVLIGTVAPAPIWILEEEKTVFAKKCRLEKFGGRKIEWNISDEAELLKGIEKGKYEFIILPYSVKDCKKPHASERYASHKLCDENLCFSLPKNHKLAKRKQLSFADMDGENFIVFSEIGFWDGIHKTHLPSSKFLVQSDKFTLEELTQNSALPHFVTDLSLKHFNRPIKNKAVIPIADKAAHAEFFLWERR